LSGILRPGIRGVKQDTERPRAVVARLEAQVLSSPIQRTKRSRRPRAGGPVRRAARPRRGVGRAPVLAGAGPRARL